MRWVNKLILRLRSLLRRSEVEGELDEELRYHLKRQIEENIRRGMTPKEAHRAARLEFGGVEEYKEECRDLRGVAWIETIWQDVRYGVRMLVKSPGFTTIAVLSLALGIGANTAIFSVVNAILLRQLPFADPERLVVVKERSLESERGGFNARNPEMAHSFAWLQDDEIFESLSVLMGSSVTTTWVDARAEVFREQLVSHEIFETLGVSPLLGRSFSREDLDDTIVISYGFWQRHFGGRSDIVGQTLDYGKRTGQTIVGVMPPGFYIFHRYNNVDIWSGFALDSNSNDRWTTIARLRQGISVEQAEERCRAISRALVSSTADSQWRLQLESLQESKSRSYQGRLHLLQGAVCLVLLIACANVAGLLLGRGASRRRELATRKALGAGQMRLCRQLFAESLLLAASGGALGILLALGGIRIFVAIAGDFYPPTEEFRIDRMVLAVSMGVSLATGIVFGLFPALQGARVDANAALKDGTRTIGGPVGQRIRGILVATQVALSVVLLIGSGLMINSLARMLREDFGFDPDHLLTMRVELQGRKYVERIPIEFEGVSVPGQGGTASRVKPAAEQFWSQALAQLRTLPEVQSVGFSSTLPPSSPWLCAVTNPISPSAELSGIPYPSIHEVDAGYFSAMGIPLLRGSMLSGRESAVSRGVAVVNEIFAETYFPGEDPVGKQVSVSFGGWNRFNRWNRSNQRYLFLNRPREIIGVVQGVKYDFRHPPKPEIFIPYQQHLRDFLHGGHARMHIDKEFVIRTHGEPEDLATAVRQMVIAMNPGEFTLDIRTMRARVADSGQIVPVRFWMRLLSVFAVLAVFLAAVGLYGVVSYTVTSRTHEIGIRMALGAGYRSVIKLIGKEALVVVAVGVSGGLVAAMGLVRFIKTQLYEVTAADPLTVVAVMLALLIATFVASYVPARRATKVDPMVALRYE